MQVGFGAGLAAIAFALQPNWVVDWVAAMSSINAYHPYVLRPGGVVLLLAALRWRRPEARVLLTTALIPGTPAVYDALVPFVAVVTLGPSTLREAMILAIVSFGVLPFLVTGATYHEWAERTANANLVFVLLPLLVAVLRRSNRPVADLGGHGNLGEHDARAA